jgi:hypothetical protein
MYQTDAELQDATFPKDENGKPIREAMRTLEYGKENYWTGQKNGRACYESDCSDKFRYVFPEHG